MSDTGGSAFPIVGDHGLRMENSEGMNLRDYFAAKAMQAFWFDPESTFSAKKENAATWAYAMADAMLEARKS